MTRILIVDNDVPTRELIKERLAQDPKKVVVAETGNGKEAVALAKARHPDIVLMDLSLDGTMNGLAATKQIKKQCPNTRVILVTNYDYPDLRERARESPQMVGFSAYLTKSEIGPRLLAVIDEVTN